jgi:PAS domain S-box-containing protein
LFFFILALTSWLSARSLEGAVKELRRINQELDKRVEERTLELSKTNQQLETEIQERIKTERALQESEIRFREMADLLPTCICEFDLNLRLTYVNKIGYELFISPADFFDSEVNVMDFFHPEDRQKAIKNIERVQKGERIGPQEYRIITKKDGNFIARKNRPLS